MTILTPKEVLKALIDDKKLEYSWWRDNGGNHRWRFFEPRENGVSIEALLERQFIFRLAKGTIDIGDISFPKPDSEPRKAGEEYWVADPTHTDYTFKYDWYTDESYEQILTRGFLHRSRENAIAHAKALIKLSGGTVDE